MIEALKRAVLSNTVIMIIKEVECLCTFFGLLGQKYSLNVW